MARNFNKQSSVIKIFERTWLTNLIFALALLPACIWATRARLFDEQNIDLFTGFIAGVANGIPGICMTIVLVAWFYSKFDKYSSWGRELGNASYWVYLIHFPIVVAVAGVISVLNISAVSKYFATISVLIPLIALSYYALVLNTPLRYIIVGRSG